MFVHVIVESARPQRPQSESEGENKKASESESENKSEWSGTRSTARAQRPRSESESESEGAANKRAAFERGGRVERGVRRVSVGAERGEMRRHSRQATGL